jgi:peroxiredoxin
MLRAAIPVALLAMAWCASPVRAAARPALAPDFEATTVDGERFSLADARRGHKAVVLVFLSTACPYALYFADHIRELDEAYRSRGVLLVGVNSNQFESVEEIREHAREKGHRFAILRDESARIADAMGADRTPEAFVVGADGALLYRGWVKSKLRSPDLQRALDAVLAGKRVRLPETKAFGCAIDRPRR